MSRYYHCEYDHQNKLRQYLQKRGLIPNFKQHSQAQQNAHARQARKPGITNENPRKDTAQRKQYGTQRQYYFESMEVCGHQRNRQTDDSHKLPHLIQYFIYIQTHRLVLFPHKNVTQQVAHNGNSPDDYDNVYDLANAIKDNQIAFQKYLRATMPTAVANANTNIDNIILQLKSTNDHAKLIFQTVYDPLSVDQDDTGLSANALSMLSAFSNGQMYQYLNGSANGGTYIPVGLNQNLQTHAQNGEIYLADVYSAFLHHAWTNVNIANADVHPTATGHAAIANLLIESGYFPSVANIDGDIDGDEKIDVSDAVAVLTEYARIAAGNEAQFNPAQKKSADVNEDGMLDVSDAVGILIYYAKQASGQTPSFS